MQRALHNTLRTENGRENWNNELILPLFGNITRVAHTHQFTRAEGTTEETSHNSIGHGTQVPPEIRVTANSSVMNTCHFTRTDPHRDVSCMDGILIDLNNIHIYMYICIYRYRVAGLLWSLGPLQNSEWASSDHPFGSEWPLGNFGSPLRKMGSKHEPFFPQFVPLFFGRKNECVELRKTIKKTK